MNDGLVWRDIPLPDVLEAALADLAFYNGVSTDMLIRQVCQLAVDEPQRFGLKIGQDSA